MFFLILLILVGIILLILEIMILPGLIAGILGTAMIMVGVWIGYNTYGSSTGHIIAAGTAAATAASLYFAFKSNVWQRFSLQQANSSNIKRVDELHILPGEIGKTISVLRPMGTAMFKDERIEVQTFGEMIDANVNIEVVQVMPNKLIVKKATTNDPTQGNQTAEQGTNV